MIDIWINCPDRETAGRIASLSVGARLAACANILAPIECVYRWRGAVERAGEVPLVLKTRAALFDELAEFVRSNHPYKVPSIVATDLPLVDAAFAGWLAEETREPERP